jgi:hypothetical protein
MSWLSEHLGSPELLLVAFEVILIGLCGAPALFVARGRGRSPVGWFFLGLGISFAVMAAYALVLPSAPQVVAWLGVLVAPAIIMALPKLAANRDAGQEPSAS